MVSVFLNRLHQNRVFRPDIHQNSNLKVHFGAWASVERGVCQKTNDFVERDLVVACVFMNVLEVGQLLGDGLVDDLRGAYRIDVLKACRTASWCWPCK